MLPAAGVSAVPRFAMPFALPRRPSSNVVCRRMAVHAFDVCRRMAVQACDTFLWRRIAVQASDSGPRGPDAARPATTKAAATPIAMRCHARPFTKLARKPLAPPGRLKFAPDGCADGRTLRHVEQTPRSAGPGVFKAPHLEQATTEAGVFMLRMYRAPGLRFSATRCDAAARLPTLGVFVAGCSGGFCRRRRYRLLPGA